MAATLEEVRHSLAHLMAYAVQELYGPLKMGVGPITESGFYYDLDLPHRLVPEDLPAIEDKMRELLKRDINFSKEVVSAETARALFAHDPYKQELIEEIVSRGELISLYRCGNFVDLCRGPHIEHVREVPFKGFRLSHVAGSYWRGNERNPMLQRIYGFAFADPKELKEYLRLREEAKRRDHRRLGREMELFSLHEDAGPGLVYWHPKAGRIRVAIEDFWRHEHLNHGYEIVFSPHLGKANLWQISGHLSYYQESMFAPMDIDGSDYYLKPMNCPFHIKMYSTNPRSYRDLPIRMAELGTVYRYERSGTLHGTMRVRGFTQDDAHIFCTPEQIEAEILQVLRFSTRLLRAFGFEKFHAFLSTRPQQAVGETDRWRVAEAALRRALEREALPFDIDEGGGAFYGPKIDLKVQDAMQRQWQLSTIQFDFNLPERFDMTFVDRDGQQKRPYMVHRALLGSLERFFGVLIEHYGGNFPLWLAPVQVVVIPIRQTHNEAAAALVERLRSSGLRVELLDRDENLNQKIKRSRQDRVPLTVVLGDKEIQQGMLALRLPGNRVVNDILIEDFISKALALNVNKAVDVSVGFPAAEEEN